MLRDPLPPATAHVSQTQERRLNTIVPVSRQTWLRIQSNHRAAVAFAARSHLKSQFAMKALIHHNPACGTSRKTLEILRESGADVIVNEYLKTPPSRDEL